MPSVFDYTDYRRYLQDYYAWAKRNKGGFSHRAFLANAGMSGPTYLKRVMEGLHDLTPNSLPKFAKALELAAPEARYFEALVGFNQATTPDGKDLHFKKLMELVPARSQATLERGQYDYYRDWYNVAVRELLAIMPWRGNALEFSRQLTPPVPPGKVKKAIELLQTLGLLTQVPGEGMRPTKALLKTDPNMESLLLPRFHQSMAKLAVEALNRFPRHERYFSGTTVSVSRETYDIIVEKIRAVRREILQQVQADPSPERVYHLNMQLFPLTTGPRKRGRKKKR
ncbi:MAG TPA: TIGR02147 family protein [Fibrobacteria bacterium]|jgi:uncharacterized protein (TIGR02147 family)|nr:TIGR02147 family protein [Fibrobacteria bacterium]